MKIGMIQMDAAAGHMEHNIAHGFELYGRGGGAF